LLHSANQIFLATVESRHQVSAHLFGGAEAPDIVPQQEETPPLRLAA
jgi:hypothetical protein